MATEVQESLNIIESMVKTLKNTQVNFKKCPKARLTRNYIETKIKCTDQYWGKYQLAYDCIIRNTPKEKVSQVPYLVNNEFYEHEELYISLRSDFMDLLVPEVNASITSHAASISSQQQYVMLPKIQLPNFSGQYEEWMSFYDLFNSLVHTNKSLTDVQKLHYLKTTITGEAASILKHLQVTDSNYQKAWDLLKSRYSNKRMTFNAIIKKFFAQKKITLNTSNNIKNLLDTTIECLHHLNCMEINTQSWDPIIRYVIVQKLDCETHKDWEEHVSTIDKDSLPTLELFQMFLENRYRTLELTEPTKHKATTSLVPIREKAFHVTTTEEKRKKCKMCKEAHTLSHCTTFGKCTPLQRTEFIKSNNLCFNCLASGYSVRQCRITICCRLCRRRHHTLLHENKEDNATMSNTLGNIENAHIKQPEVTLHTNVEQIEPESTPTTASYVTTTQSTALLATANVAVISEDNYKITLRALIDQGSQASFISERATQLLKAKRYPIKGTVVGVGSTKEDLKQVVQIKIESRCEAFDLDVRTYVMSKPLTTKIPSHTIKTSNWPHLDGLVLADPNYYKPSSIDLLLGVDVYAQIVQNQLIRGPPGSPTAQKTNLGWILFRKIEDSLPQSDSFMVLHHQIIVDDLLKILWEVDQDLNRKYTKEEEDCENFYEENYRRDNNGKYIVRLPFRSKVPLTTGGETRDVAMKRLITQERRLQQTPDLREEYDKVLEEYLTMRHMVEVPKDEINKPSIYLPHHAVIRTDKETTKIRVVFDASCKNNNGIALNDLLMTGPVLQEDMRSILMRWRMHKVCFASDIVKMYRMIWMNDQDIDYQRILWRRNAQTSNNKTDNDRAEVRDYRLRTVTFGTASAPYLAIKTLTKLACEEGKTYPEAAKIIREDFYVDDLLSGCDTTEEAINISKHVMSILQKGDFETQKWTSNDKEFLKSLDSNKVTTKADLDLNVDAKIKALGLTWNLKEDEFHYQPQLEPMIYYQITKRNILSDLQKLLDPLGWIAPAIVPAKILIQKLWLEGVTWDQEIPETLKNQWKYIREDLENVNEIKITRWLNTTKNQKEQRTLHGFCDASERAYAAVVYCRVLTESGDVKINIVAARTKVAPVKTISLPRLELSGACLLAKLLHKVSQAMRISTPNVFAWTDSTIVLAWLSGEPSRWKPFVANRVVEILEHTSSSQWFHVQSSHNPADIASRGLSLSKLKHKNLWWNGPALLNSEEIEFTKPQTLSTELKKRKIQSYVNVTECEEKYIKFEEYYSLTELLRIIVHCKRFLNMKRDPRRLENTITQEELQNALDICIRRVQEEEFIEKIKRLRKGKSVKTTSILKTLNPFLDAQNILKVGGRLRNADVDENLQHPIILGKRNSFVPLLLADAHQRTMHGGLKLMITYLMSKYYIVGCKSLVKQYVQKCLTCARQRAASRTQIMGDLPKPRVTPSRPFSRSGVDFAGPVYVLNSKGKGAKTSKAYICIFVCMAVKAFHLELVSDMTSNAFIAAFKRFVARRGRCIEIWSDNGTNFVASNKELSKMWKDAGFEMSNHMVEQLANDGTQWHFTPPYSPNFGGLWEAGVKSVKHHLRRICPDFFGRDFDPL